MKKAILCCQAFHARRALMYYQEQFPETEILVVSHRDTGISGTTWMKTRQELTSCSEKWSDAVDNFMRF
ncbi:MAG: hypothetical protein ACLTSZ_12320 [Lachnospiraceae bacterium]